MSVETPRHLASFVLTALSVPHRVPGGRGVPRYGTYVDSEEQYADEMAAWKARKR